MTYWFTSDQHFNHFNIISYCDRPFSNRKEMDSTIIKNWNRVVKYTDTVIIVGDFCFPNKDRGYQHYFDALMGNKIFLRGSHDGGMNPIARSLVCKYGGLDWWIQHEPIWKYMYNICGHKHHNWKYEIKGDKICINVGVDIWNFTPVSIQDLLDLVRKVM